MIIYKLSYNKIFKYLIKPFIQLVLMIGIVSFGLGWFYDLFGTPILLWKIFLLTLAVSSVITLIPLAILGFIYLSKDIETQITVEPNKNMLVYKNGNKSMEIEISEIKKVVFVSNSRLKRQTFAWVFWDNLSYHKIILNNKTLNVSCFIVDDLKDLVPLNLYEEESHVFPHFKNIITTVDS